MRASIARCWRATGARRVAERGDEQFLSRRVALALASFGVVSLCAGFAATIFFVEPDVTSAGNDGFSSSALGHRALVELLERAGHDVVLSRGRSAEKVAGGALLVVLEPDGLAEDAAERLAEMIAAAPRALVALPKWTGAEGAEEAGWLDSVELHGADAPDSVLRTCGIAAPVVRIEAGEPSWGSSSFTARPTLEQAQLLAWGALEPWLAADEGVLLGRAVRADERELFVLADPDLLANHGLDDGDNARLALELFARLAPPGSAIVFDETLHGFTVVENVWAALGRFPLVLVLVHGLLVGAVLAWSGMRRFGAPLAGPTGRGTGKHVLVANTAELLLHAGRSRHVLTRYLAQHRRRVARAFHIAADRPGAERRSELERVERAKAPRVTLAEAEAAVQRALDARSGSAQRTLRAARLVREWSREMLHGAR